MRFDSEHQFVKLVWYGLLAINGVFMLAMIIAAILKPISVWGQEEAFRINPNYMQPLLDQSREGIRWVVKQFDLDGEGNLANWVSSIQFLLGGLMALWAYTLQRNKKSFVAFGWLLLSAGLIALSIEETVMIHEFIGSALKTDETVNVGVFSLYKVYRWVLVYSIPFIGAFTFLMVWTRKAMPSAPQARKILMIALVCYLGAFILESLASMVPHAFLRAEMMIEEGAEIVGTLLIIAGIGTYLTHYYNDTNISETA